MAETIRGNTVFKNGIIHIKVGHVINFDLIREALSCTVRTKYTSGARKLKFDQLYFINEWLANDVLLVSEIFLGYEEALWPKKLEISHASQILTNEHQLLVLS